MAERQQGGGDVPEAPTPPTGSSQPQTPTAKDDMIGCVVALEAALLPCLPARELQAIDRSPHPSHQIDVERHTRDFMEAAKKLQLYFVGLLREDQPSRAEMLRKDIAAMEEEMEAKSELIKSQEQLIQGWSKRLKDQLDRHKAELAKLEELPPKLSTDHAGAQSREECESKDINQSKQFKWRPPNIGTKQEWQERFRNRGKGKKGTAESENVETPKASFSNISLHNEEFFTESKNNRDLESPLPEGSAFVIEDMIPSASVLKQLGIVVESGKNYGSIKDLLNSSKNSSPVGRASLSLSAMKSLMCCEKAETLGSEHHDDQVL